LRLASGLGFDVVIGGELKDLYRWGDLRLGRLQDPIPPGRRKGGKCLVEASPGRILNGDPPLVLVHRGTEDMPLSLEVRAPSPLAAPLVRDQIRALAFSVADRDWLCRAQRLDLLAWMAAA